MSNPQEVQAGVSVFSFKAVGLDGQQHDLAQFAGQVLLIVNVASECGFTSQYSGLEELYKMLKPRGFSVLGFPCNQFGGQEPGGSEEIRTFCDARYHLTFPMFSKIEVNGDRAHPLFQYLKSQVPGLLGIEAIKWNFTKFLCDRAGKVVSRHAPTTSPESLRSQVEALL